MAGEAGEVGDCHVLAVAAAEGGAARAFLLDRGGSRLIVVHWADGAGIASRVVDLSVPLPRNTISAAAFEERLVVSDASAGVFAINIADGTVARPAGVSAPALVARDGLILWARRNGVMMAELTAEAAPAAAGTQVLVAKALDHPASMVLMADDDGDEAFGCTLVIGCYGAIELVDVAATGVYVSRSRTLPMNPPLAYDPVLVTAGPAGHGRFAYARDEGGVGLAAIDVWDDVAIAFPKDDRGYGSVRGAVPSIDSRACLVTVRSGETVAWSPGSTPRPIADPAGDVVLWQGNRALVVDRERAVLREAVLSFAP